MIKKIGIIAAMESEIEFLRNELEITNDVKLMGSKFYEAIINDLDIVIAQCGVGKVNASIACSVLINQYECDFIINTGIAGGVAPLKTKDIVIASGLQYHDFDTTIFGYAYGQVPGLPKVFAPSIEARLAVKRALNKMNLDYTEGMIYTADQFTSSLDQLSKVGDCSGCAIEMEGAAIAQTCVKANVEFIVIRYISDIIGSENQVSDYLQFEKEMANRSSKICLEILNNL